MMNERNASVEATWAEPMTSDGKPRRCRVLVVEDDRDLRSSIREMFLMRGFLVNVAKDGKEAFEVAMDEAYDVVVTDIRMPRMGGTRLSKLLAVFGHKPKVILMTAYPDWEIQDEARGVQAAEVFLKPVDLEKLADAVSRVSGIPS